MSGGFTRYADDDNIYVLKVDGSAMKISNSLLHWNMTMSRWEAANFGDAIKQIEPGDTIIVPVEVERIAWLREFKDFTQILYQIAVTAGVAITLF
jgi:hypothetical protein